jgi:hypothetical protein
MRWTTGIDGPSVSIDYIEDYEARVNTKAAQLPWRSLLDRLTASDAVSELAAITGLTLKNTSRSLGYAGSCRHVG